MNRIQQIIIILLAITIIISIYACEKAQPQESIVDNIPMNGSSLPSDVESNIDPPQLHFPDYRDLMVIKYDKFGEQVWMKLFEDGEDSGIYPIAVRTDDDGNFYLTGWGLFKDDIAGFRSYGTLKYDKSGSLLETVVYPELFLQMQNPKLPIIYQDVEGNITTYSMIDHEQSEFDVVRYNNKGNLLWSAHFTDMEHKFVPPRLVSVDKFGNTYTISYSRRDPREYLLLKYDNDGKILRQSVYSNASLETICKYTMDAQGSLYILGTNSTGENNIVIAVKLDADGEEQWSVRYAESGRNDIPADMAVDEAGNVHLLFYSDSMSSDEDNYFVTVKYDAVGNKLWESHYAGDPNNHSKIEIEHHENPSGGSGVGVQSTTTHIGSPEELAIDSQDNVYVAGKSDGEYVAIKYDSNGNELWASLGENWSQHVTSIAIDSGDNIYITGTIIIDGTHNSFDTYNYDSYGNLIWKAKYSQAHFQDYPWLVADKFNNVYLISSLSRYKEEKYP